MEYQKIINRLDYTTNQPFEFITRNWVEINDDSKGRYDNSNIIFKTSMIRQIYVIIVIHMYLLKELQQLQTRKLQAQQ